MDHLDHLYLLKQILRYKRYKYISVIPLCFPFMCSVASFRCVFRGLAVYFFSFLRYFYFIFFIFKDFDCTVDYFKHAGLPKQAVSGGQKTVYSGTQRK